MARSTTVPVAGNIARKSFAEEEKAKEEYYAEQLKKYGRLMVYSNKKKNGFYLIEPAEGGETVASRYTTDGGKIRQEAFDPKALPASSDEATWRSRGLSLEECEQIKEKRSLSNRRKQWLDSVIEQAYQGRNPAEIANGVNYSMQFTDDLTNPVIYHDYAGTTLYMDFTGKALENGEEKQLNQEEGSYLSQGLKNKWISFEGGLSSADWQAIYEGVEEKYDSVPGFKPVNSVQKAAVISCGKELSQADLDKLGDLADLIKDDYDQDPNRFYKTDLNAKSIKGAFTYTELTVVGEVAVVPFKHKDLEQIAKRLESGEEDKARALMLEKFQEAGLAKAKSLTEEKEGQSPLDEMESFQKLEAAKEFKELAEKMENEMTEQSNIYQLPEKYKEDIDEKYWQQSGEQLDQLVKSDDPILRSVAACYGRDKDLDKLVSDKDAEVRSYVAEQGRNEDLDKLVNDPDENVRRYVAGQGRDQDLDKLVNDEDPFVRMDVAKQGRDKDLDKLVHDSNLHVTQVARTQIRNRDLENLRQLQATGKIEKDTDISRIADQLPVWRESDKGEDKEQLAYYGRDKDLDKLVSDSDEFVRNVVAGRGRDKDLDKLVNDSDWQVRMTVASHGRDKDLDKLVNDPEEKVRMEVAYQGRDKDLDILVNDKNEYVRRDVAWQGRDKDLDKLVSDKNWEVRMAVAKIGRDKDLDKLVNDPDEGVRAGVAFRGRDKDLDKLVHDSNLHVTQVSRTQIRNRDLENLRHLQEEGKIKEGADLDKIADQLPGWRESNKRGDKLQLAKYGRDSDLDKLGRGESYLVRKTVALRGRDKDLDRLVDDPNWEVRKAVASQGRDKDLDKLVSDPDYNVRSSVASQGRDKDLDILVSDKNRLVRSEVALQGRDEDLDKLVNDENAAVRMEVAKQERDKDLDKLVSDKSFAIREEIAKIGRDKDLDKLVNDKAPFVRSFVALQGRDKDLDKLVSDKSDLVRISVAEIGRDKDLKKLARDKDSEVRMAVVEYSEYRADLAKDQDPAVRDFVSQRRAADLEKRRREAARRGLER